MAVVVYGADLLTDLIDLRTKKTQLCKEGLQLKWDGKYIYVSGAQSGIDVARYTLEELEG